MSEIDLVRWYTGWNEETARTAIGVWRELRPDWTAEGLHQYFVSPDRKTCCQWCAERPDGEDMVQSTDANAAIAA